MIHQASITYAGLNHTKQYIRIVDRLQCGEQGVMVAALTLINVVIHAASIPVLNTANDDQQLSSAEYDSTTRLARLVALLVIYSISSYLLCSLTHSLASLVRSLAGPFPVLSFQLLKKLLQSSEIKCYRDFLPFQDHKKDHRNGKGQRKTKEQKQRMNKKLEKQIKN